MHWPQACVPPELLSGCAIRMSWFMLGITEGRVLEVLNNNKDRRSPMRSTTCMPQVPWTNSWFWGNNFFLCCNEQALGLGPDTSYAENKIISVGLAADRICLAQWKQARLLRRMLRYGKVFHALPSSVLEVLWSAQVLPLGVTLSKRRRLALSLGEPKEHAGTQGDKL